MIKKSRMLFSFQLHTVDQEHYKSFKKFIETISAFQLHTVDQEPGVPLNIRMFFIYFQLHTVDQEPIAKAVGQGLGQGSFNSTRQIRNREQNFCRAEYKKPFNSTRQIRNRRKYRTQLHKEYPFNSTRQIRNHTQTPVNRIYAVLSTPHGRLGTNNRGKDFYLSQLLSTPHGRLGTLQAVCVKMDQLQRLSTPHGRLGTIKELMEDEWYDYFQLHTVDQEP